MEEVVRVCGLQKKFGKFEALRNVSFSVKPGEVMGFIGPNGAGKSTTIRVLLGSIKASGGEARIFGRDVWRDRLEIHKRLSYVPGDVALWGNLTGAEIISVLMKLHGGGSAKRRDSLVDLFELDVKKKAKAYSKGNRQKVGLVAALAVESDLYIFDEPTSGLDPLMERAFQEEVAGLRANGKAVLLSSHILSEVDKLADSVAIIRAGEVVESGSLENLRHLTRTGVSFTTASDASALAQLPCVHDFSQKGARVTLSADSAHMADVLACAAHFDMQGFEAAPPTLEDMFMRHYGAADASQPAGMR